MDGWNCRHCGHHNDQYAYQCRGCQRPRPSRYEQRSDRGAHRRSSQRLPDPYGLLGVDREASTAEIRRAYLRRIKQVHPDANPGQEEEAKRVILAYELLSDSQRRRQYDLTCETPTGPTGDEEFHGRGPGRGSRTGYATSSRPMSEPVERPSVSEPASQPHSRVRVAVTFLVLAVAAMFIVNAGRSGCVDQSPAEAAAQARTQALGMIATDYQRFIDAGFPGSETLLVEVLRAHGTPQMCDDFLNSGNGTLAKAALDWACTTGYILALESASPNGHIVINGGSTDGPRQSEGP